MFAIVFVVIVVVPIAVGVPAMPVFIPPTMIAGVAILAGFVQIAASVIGLAAFAPMMLNGFMKAMIGAGDSLLAIVVGAQARSAAEEQKSRHYSPSQCDFCCSKNSRLKFGLHPDFLLDLKWVVKTRF
jgi:hypothetical protein